jgi:hypothetical protein
MSPEERARLIENIKIDGRLTSGVLACVNADQSVEMLSGHNRADCSIDAGYPEADVLVITTPLTEERKTAIQLSHNAIVGKDNPSVLAEMYRGLGLDAKMFSGLTDDVLDYQKLSIGGLAAGVQYEELLIAFLPEDRHAFELSLNRVKKSNRLAATHFARFADFDAVFDAVVAVKDKRGGDMNRRLLSDWLWRLARRRRPHLD